MKYQRIIISISLLISISQITPIRSQTTTSNQRFVVCDDNNHLPIGNSLIINKKYNLTIVTNQNGEFYCDSKIDSVEISRIGYLSKKISLKNTEQDTIFLDPTIKKLPELLIEPKDIQYNQKKLSKALRGILKYHDKLSSNFQSVADLKYIVKNNEIVTELFEGRYEYVDDLGYKKKYEPYLIQETVIALEQRQSLNHSINKPDFERGYYSTLKRPLNFILFNGLHYKTPKDATLLTVSDTTVDSSGTRFQISSVENKVLTKTKESIEEDWFDEIYYIFIPKGTEVPVIEKYELHYQSLKNTPSFKQWDFIKFTSEFKTLNGIHVPSVYRFEKEQIDFIKSESISNSTSIEASLDFFKHKSIDKNKSKSSQFSTNYNPAFWRNFEIKPSTISQLSTIVPLSEQFVNSSVIKDSLQRLVDLAQIENNLENSNKKYSLFVLWEDYTTLLPLNYSLDWLPGDRMDIYIICTSKDIVNYYQYLSGNDYMYYNHYHIQEFRNSFKAENFNTNAKDFILYDNLKDNKILSSSDWEELRSAVLK